MGSLDTWDGLELKDCYTRLVPVDYELVSQLAKKYHWSKDYTLRRIISMWADFYRDGFDIGVDPARGTIPPRVPDDLQQEIAADTARKGGQQHRK